MQFRATKLGCAVRMVVDSILPHAESGPNGHGKDAPQFTQFREFFIKVRFHYILYSNIKSLSQNDRAKMTELDDRTQLSGR